MKTIILNLLCIFVLLFLSCAEKEPPETPAPDIPVFQTRSQEVPIYREYVGQVFGFKDIAIQARVEGYLENIHFEEGSRIEKGALLYTVESQPFEEKVAAKMSHVAGSKSQLARAQSDLNRIKPLAEQNAVSQSDLDSAVAEHETSIEVVKAAEADLRASEIELGYTKIYSPVDGVIGKTKAKVGDFVGRSSETMVLNTVSQIDTVLVQFFVTETEYLKFRRYLSESDPADRDREKAQLDMILVDGSVYEHKGEIDFVDREVDPFTGALLVQASFPNPEEILRPGQFAKIKAKVQVVEDGILIPQRCVMELQGLYSVYVVDESNQIKQRDVTAGAKIGEFWLITEGLQPGEKVVYEGLQKVKDEMTVNPVVREIKSTLEEE